MTSSDLKTDQECVALLTDLEVILQRAEQLKERLATECNYTGALWGVVRPLRTAVERARDEIGPDEEENLPIEPQEDDWTTDDFTTFHQVDGRRTIVVGPDQEWRDVVHEQMLVDGCWTNVWRVSDHGNVELVAWE